MGNMFLLLRSPYECSVLQGIKTLKSGNGDAVILFSNAVYYATDMDEKRKLDELGLRIYAMKDALEARGVDGQVLDGVELADYDSAIEKMMEDYDKVITL